MKMSGRMIEMNDSMKEKWENRWIKEWEKWIINDGQTLWIPWIYILLSTTSGGRSKSLIALNG